jgi:queuine tRNA-ribosyltransferase
VGLSFAVSAVQGRARRGRIGTAHGFIETPAFMPVGTLGAVKGIAPDVLESVGAEVMLANLYHLAVRPGIDTIAALGGLHAFTGWRRPLLTDSGGFQVMSLASLRRVDEEGVTFRNHVDGGALRFTPESVVGMQRALGVDIAMMLDECPPWPAPAAAVAIATERTLRWAGRARNGRLQPLALPACSELSRAASFATNGSTLPLVSASWSSMAMPLVASAWVNRQPSAARSWSGRHPGCQKRAPGI